MYMKSGEYLWQAVWHCAQYMRCQWVSRSKQKGILWCSSRQTLTLSLTAGRRALKQVAKNTPPPKELLNATALLYLTALSRSDCITRTGVRIAASIKPNMARRHRILRTTSSMVLIYTHSVQFIRTVTAWLGYEQPPPSISPQTRTHWAGRNSKAAYIHLCCDNACLITLLCADRH